MKKWKCKVCAYDHSGDTPPDKCPVCGASQSDFVEIENEIPKQQGDDIQLECTVCKYVHKGAEPPENCPVCGADQSKFVRAETDSSSPQEDAPPNTSTQDSDSFQMKVYQLLEEHVITHHLHPISVHVPNGVIPVAFIFVFMTAIFGAGTLALAAFYNTVFVMLAMPVVLLTGYIEWQKRYGGTYTDLFVTKLVCGGVVFAMSVILALWGFVDSDITQSTGDISLLYVFFHLIMLAAAGIAGHLGGKLVFKE